MISFPTLVRKKIVLLALGVFVVVGVGIFFVLKNYADIPFLHNVNLSEFPTLSVSNQANTFKIDVNQSKLFALIRGQELQSTIREIKVETSDTVQNTRNTWGKEPYSSVGIKQVGNDRVITIHIDIKQLTEAGWSDRMISDEIEIMILQGIFVHKDLYTTTAMVNDARDKGRALSKENGYPNFVILQK